MLKYGDEEPWNASKSISTSIPKLFSTYTVLEEEQKVFSTYKEHVEKSMIYDMLFITHHRLDDLHRRCSRCHRVLGIQHCLTPRESWTRIGLRPPVKPTQKQHQQAQQTIYRLYVHVHLWQRQLCCLKSHFFICFRNSNHGPKIALQLINMRTEKQGTWYINFLASYHFLDLCVCFFKDFLGRFKSFEVPGDKHCLSIDVNDRCLEISVFELGIQGLLPVVCIL